MLKNAFRIGPTAIIFGIIAILPHSGVRIVAGQENQGQDVRSLMRPQTDEEKLVAAFFDRFRAGAKPLQPGQTTGVGPQPFPLPPPPGTYASDFDQLRSAVCGAKVIVFGRLKETRTMFNTKETYLVTIYSLVIDRWLRPVSPTNRPQEISIAAAGGEVMLDALKTVAIPPVKLDVDKPTVLFLDRIEKTRTYTLARLLGAITFEGKDLRVGYPTRMSIFDKPQTQVSVLTVLGNAAATCGD